MSLPWDDPNSDPLQDIKDALARAKEREYAFPWQPKFIVYPDWLAIGTSMDTYVAIYPYSATNPTSKYRVTKNVDWLAFSAGDKPDYKYTEYDKMDEAIAARDHLNHPTKKVITDEVSDNGETT